MFFINQVRYLLYVVSKYIFYYNTKMKNSLLVLKIL